MSETDKTPDITLDNADVVFKSRENFIRIILQSKKVKEWGFGIGLINQLGVDSKFPGENPGYYRNERIATPAYLDGPFHVLLSPKATEDLKWIIENQTDFTMIDDEEET